MSETNLRETLAGLPSAFNPSRIGAPRGNRTPASSPGEVNSRLSSLFTAYNIARSAARKGYIEPKRLNRALGIAMRSGETHIDRYHTTPERCECPDWRYRIRYTGGNCKGQLCLALKELAA